MSDTEAPTAPSPSETDEASGARADGTPSTPPSGQVALRWTRHPGSPRESEDVPGDLLDGLPRRSIWRGTVIGPVLIVLGVIAAYAAITLLWPLTAVAPTATAAEVPPLTAPASAPAWPAEGSAAVAVAGFEHTGEGGTIASTAEVAPIASITKLVTALMVLDRLPLTPGESGPDYAFTSRDRNDYSSYRSRGESALDVPVGRTLTEYEMLQAVLVGSANNYAARLADQFWPTDEVFAEAAAEWLSGHGIEGVTVVEPTGIDDGNVATPAGVIALSRKALEHPVIAQIVATPMVTIPGVGEVENTNDLLVDPGVVGIKTGTLISRRGEINDLAAAKDIAVGGGTVRAFATVLSQPTDTARDEAARALLAQVEAELALPHVIPAGTVVGTVETAWGQSVEIRTTADAAAVLWNGASTSSAASLAVTEWEASAPTGTFTLTGPLGAVTVDAVTVTAIEEPSPWWRLTHPLELFGLVG